MTNDEKEEFTFSEVGTSTLPNFGANTVTDEGVNLFPQLGKKLTLQVKSWEMGFADAKTGKTKPVVLLEMDNGETYQRVLGANMRKKIASLGIKKPKELIGLYMTFEKYDTRSSNPLFRWGLRITTISKDKTLE